LEQVVQAAVETQELSVEIHYLALLLHLQVAVEVVLLVVRVVLVAQAAVVALELMAAPRLQGKVL
jgi:hypothetical protein